MGPTELMNNLLLNSNSDSTTLSVPKLRDDGSNWSDVYFTLPLVVRSDSASPVDIHRTLVICTGLRWMSGDCLVIVR